MSTESSLRPLTSDEIEKLLYQPKFRIEYTDIIRQIEFKLQQIRDSKVFDSFCLNDDYDEDSDINDFIGNIVVIIYSYARVIVDIYYDSNTLADDMYDARYNNIEFIIRRYFETQNIKTVSLEKIEKILLRGACKKNLIKHLNLLQIKKEIDDLLVILERDETLQKYITDPEFRNSNVLQDYLLKYQDEIRLIFDDICFLPDVDIVRELYSS